MRRERPPQRLRRHAVGLIVGRDPRHEFAFIEVSDTTYAVDRKHKIPLYVNAGVPSYIVNIPLRQVEFYGSVQDLGAEHGRVFTDRDTLEILGVAIPIAVLFNE